MSWINRRIKIIASLRIILAEAKKQNKLMTQDMLINWLCKKYGCSRRTAIEYIKIAKI